MYIRINLFLFFFIIFNTDTLYAAAFYDQNIILYTVKLKSSPEDCLSLNLLVRHGIVYGHSSHDSFIIKPSDISTIIEQITQEKQNDVLKIEIKKVLHNLNTKLEKIIYSSLYAIKTEELIEVYNKISYPLYALLFSQEGIVIQAKKITNILQITSEAPIGQVQHITGEKFYVPIKKTNKHHFLEKYNKKFPTQFNLLSFYLKNNISKKIKPKIVEVIPFTDGSKNNEEIDLFVQSFSSPQKVYIYFLTDCHGNPLPYNFLSKLSLEFTKEIITNIIQHAKNYTRFNIKIATNEIEKIYLVKMVITKDASINKEITTGYSLISPHSKEKRTEKTVQSPFKISCFAFLCFFILLGFTTSLNK